MLLYTFCYCGRFVFSQASFGRCTLLPHESLVFVVHCMPLKLSPRTKALLMICEQHGVLAIFVKYTAEIGQRRMKGFAYGCPSCGETHNLFRFFFVKKSPRHKTGRLLNIRKSTQARLKIEEDSHFSVG